MQTACILEAISSTSRRECSYWYRSLSKIRPPRKYTHPPFSLQVIAKGHLLLESTPTQQTKTIGTCSCYVWIFVGLLSNRVGLLSNRMGLFLRERVLENMPTPLLSSHLSSSPMGVFSRDYSTSPCMHPTAYCLLPPWTSHCEGDGHDHWRTGFRWPISPERRRGWDSLPATIVPFLDHLPHPNANSAEQLAGELKCCSGLLFQVRRMHVIRWLCASWIIYTYHWWISNSGWPWGLNICL